MANWPICPWQVSAGDDKVGLTNECIKPKGCQNLCIKRKGRGFYIKLVETFILYEVLARHAPSRLQQRFLQDLSDQTYS